MKDVMIKKKWIAIVLSIVAGIVFAVQLWVHAHYQYSQLDEGDYAIKGLWFVIGKYIPFQEYGPWTNHMPLSFLIPGYVQVLFGPGLRTIRYFSIVIAMLALVAIWITARRLGGYWWGTGAVWIFAVSPAMSKFYSQSASQVLVFFMLAWMLAFSLGENLPLWRITIGAVLAGFILLTRINLAPVLIFLLGYIFWQYGWRWGLVAAVTSLIIVTIGMALYWPGIFIFIVGAFVYGGEPYLLANFITIDDIERFFLNWYQLWDVSLNIYIALLFVIGALIFLWLKREKYIYRAFLKGIFWGSIFVALMVLYIRNTTDGESGELAKTILSTIGFHLIIFMVFMLGYYFWKRWHEKKAGGLEAISTENYWKYFFFLIFIESIGAGVTLLLIPKDPKNAWFLGYSMSRIGLISATLIFSILALWLTIWTWHRPSFVSRMQAWMGSLHKNRRIYFLVLIFLIGLIILGIFMILQAVVIRDMAIKAPLIRLIPLIVLGVVIGIQTLLLISIGMETHSYVRRFLFDIFSALLGVYIILHLDQYVLASTKFRSLNAGIRSHFIPILGLIFILVFWQDRKKWKKESDFRIGVVISGLFITLIFLQIYGVLGKTYCVHCLQSYFAFFSQLGVILLIFIVPHIRKKITYLNQLITVLVILWIFTGLGYVVDFYTGLTLLAWAFLFIGILAGIKLLFTEKGVLVEYSLTAYIAVSCFGIGFLLSPTILLGGGYQDKDCDVDIISYYESFGEDLNRIIPEDSQVFFWGSSPAPLLYLPNRNIHPAQVNSAGYIEGGDTDRLLRKGYWNDLVGKQWVNEADYLIIKSNLIRGWLMDALGKGNYQLVLHKPLQGTCVQELDYLVYQHLP